MCIQVELGIARYAASFLATNRVRSCKLGNYRRRFSCGEEVAGVDDVGWKTDQSLVPSRGRFFFAAVAGGSSATFEASSLARSTN